MARKACSLEDCPKHWTTVQDEALKAAYPALITPTSISDFKRSIRKTILPTLTTRSSLVTSVRQPLPNVLNQFSYDLDFLAHRIKQLLPDTNSSDETPSLLTAWSQASGNSYHSNSNHICTKECKSLRRQPPHLWENTSTHSLRCGGCGREDIPSRPNTPVQTRINPALRLTYVPTEEQQQQYNTPFPGRMPTCPEPGTTTSTTAAAEPSITIPRLWSSPHDAHLHESYLLQTTKPIKPIFSTAHLKHSLSIFFPPSAVDLHIDPASYDLCFVHGRLECLFGACLCRGGGALSPRSRGRCYLCPFVRIEVPSSGGMVGCGKCELEGKAVYGIPVAGDGGWKEMRCGGCGNEEIKLSDPGVGKE
ncbi:MAG: hypothetical protein Q9211_003187 [Gyalolechia sp. 1 TL-2023]